MTQDAPLKRACHPPQRIPSELRRKVAPGPWAFVDNNTFPLLFGLGLGAFILLAPADGYGLVYLLGPPISLLIAALAFTIFPFKPYRGQPFTRKRPVDKDDPVVMRLVALFESRESRMVMWRAAARLCGWLLAISAAVALLRRRPLAWGFPPGVLVVYALGSAIGSYVALATEYIGWGLRTWVARETQRQGSR